MKLWADHVVWRPAQSKRHPTTKERQSQIIIITIIIIIIIIIMITI